MEIADVDRMARAVALVERLSAEAQRDAIAARRIEQPYFEFWIDKKGWERIVHPVEFWSEAARRALPFYSVEVWWHDAPPHYVYVIARAA